MHQRSNDARAAIRDRFPGGDITNLLLNIFEDSNEEVMVVNRREQFYGKMLGKATREGGTCKNPVKPSMYDARMETVMLNTCGWIFDAC